MTLVEKLGKIKQSEIILLTMSGKVLGFRAKYYNVKTDQFNYYDFNTDAIKDESVKNFIRQLKGLHSQELIRHNGLLVTEFELNNNVIISEFKNEEEVIKILSPFTKIYNKGGVSNV